MSSSSHVDQYSVISCSTGRKFAHLCSVKFQNVDIQSMKQLQLHCAMLQYSANMSVVTCTREGV